MRFFFCVQSTNTVLHHLYYSVVQMCSMMCPMIFCWELGVTEHKWSWRITCSDVSVWLSCGSPAVIVLIGPKWSKLKQKPYRTCLLWRRPGSLAYESLPQQLKAVKDVSTSVWRVPQLKLCGRGVPSLNMTERTTLAVGSFHQGLCGHDFIKTVGTCRWLMQALLLFWGSDKKKPNCRAEKYIGQRFPPHLVNLRVEQPCVLPSFQAGLVCVGV